jgi:hypothetical protein
MSSPGAERAAILRDAALWLLRMRVEWAEGAAQTRVYARITVFK